MSAPAPAIEPGADDEFDFGSSSSAGFFELLAERRIALAVTSYNCHRVVVFRLRDGRPDTLLVPALRPLGLAVRGDLLSIGAHAEIIDYRRDDALLADPKAQIDEFAGADALYLPVERHITGYLNLHDMAWAGGELWFVNSVHGCLCTRETGRHFSPRWTPPFVDGPIGNAHYHLNGMAVDAHGPAFVSCFATRALQQSWKELPADDSQIGGLIAVGSGQIIVDGLLAPHSPRLHGDHLYFCHSGYGRVERIDLRDGRRETVLELPGFTRAMCFHDDLLFVCTSQVRASETPTNALLRAALPDSIAAVYAIDLATGSVLAYSQFTGDVSQLYDIAVLADTVTPAIPALQDRIVTELYSFRT